MRAQFDLSESALSQGLTEDVVTYSVGMARGATCASSGLGCVSCSA